MAHLHSAIAHDLTALALDEPAMAISPGAAAYLQEPIDWEHLLAAWTPFADRSARSPVRAGRTGVASTMPRKLRQLRTDLRRAGWSIIRQTGSHQIWKHPLLPGLEVNLVGQDGTDAHPYQERDVREAVRRARNVKRRES